MKTTRGTKRIFAAIKVTRPDAGGDLYAPVDQFGVESGDTPSYDVTAVASRCIELNKSHDFFKHGICMECPTATECTHEQRCRLADGTRLNPRMVKDIPTPQDWRDYPTKTFHWGAIEVNPAFGNLNATFGRQRWFKTRTNANSYAGANYKTKTFVIADYYCNSVGN
jgi:hypothetical protein